MEAAAPKKIPNEFDNFARDVPVLEKNRLGID